MVVKTNTICFFQLSNFQFLLDACFMRRNAELEVHKTVLLEKENLILDHIFLLTVLRLFLVP